MSTPLEYFPTTADATISDDYFGTTVNDPYRWLEDDRSEQTHEWVTKQNALTQQYLSAIPFRGQIHQQLLDGWNYERYSSPFIEGDYIYWFKNDGLQNQSVCYRKLKADGDNGKEEIFIDPNTWSEKGTSSLSQLQFTEDGSIAVYFISHAGSDVNVARFVKTSDNSLIEDVELKNIKFSGAAFYHNKGFFYSKYDFKEGESVLTAMTDSHRLYYHVIGDKQDNDVRIFGHKDEQKRRYVSAQTSDDNKYLIISAANATSGNELFVKALTQDNVNNDNDIITLMDNSDNDFDFIDCKDDKLYIITNFEAPNKRLLAIDLPAYIPAAQSQNLTNFLKTEKQSYTVIIAESSDAVLEVSVAGNYFIANYQRVALSEPVQYDYDGKVIRDIKLPGFGTAAGFSAKRKETITYYSFTTYTSPNSIYVYDLETGESKLHFAPKVNVAGLSDCISERVTYKSKDGTADVPMIITYNPKKVNLETGANPLQLYGYGGFNISLSPAFSIPTAVWISNGGIYAVPNIRGGGEKGKQWHKAGTKYQKQNVFDDFISAAEFLIEKKYTTKDLLMIRGGSNGGLLVGACMTQRPDLFRVAIPMVGVLDMLRYHKSTAGKGWAEDYLHSEDSKEAFEYLYKYSPVHNVKEGVVYPATMITTSDHDDRVVPANSYKFAANLQLKSLNCQKATKANHPLSPIVIRIDIDAGHGAGKAITQLAQEHADIQSFALFSMGLTKID